MKPYFVDSDFQSARLSDGSRMRTLSEMRFYSPYMGSVITFPAGIVTDGGSLPLWSLALGFVCAGVSLWFPIALLGVLVALCILSVQRFGRWVRGFACHDDMYRNGYVIIHGIKIPITWREADIILQETGVADNIKLPIRWIVWTGLAIGGWVTWNKYRKLNPIVESVDLCLNCKEYGKGCPVVHPQHPVTKCTFQKV